MELQLITSIRPLTAEELSILYHWWPAIKAVGMFAFVGGLVMGPFVMLAYRHNKH